MDEFGPIEVRPHHGHAWCQRNKPARIRATYRRTHGVRHYLAAYEVHRDRLIMRCFRRKRWQELLTFLKQLRRRYPRDVRFYIVLDNFSPHKRAEIRRWATKNNVTLVFTPTYSSWLNRIEAVFAGVKHFVLRNSDYANHDEIRKAIAAYVRWRNSRPHDPKVRRAEKHKLAS